MDQLVVSVIGGFLLLPILRLKKNFPRDLRKASFIGGFPLLAGPLERDSTVFNSF